MKNSNGVWNTHMFKNFDISDDIDIIKNNAGVEVYVRQGPEDISTDNKACWVPHEKASYSPGELRFAGESRTLR